MIRRIVWALVGSYGLFVAFVLVVLQVFDVPARGAGPFLWHPPQPVELLVVALLAALFGLPLVFAVLAHAEAPETRGDTLVWRPTRARRTPRVLLVGALVVGLPTWLLSLQQRSTPLPERGNVMLEDRDLDCHWLHEGTPALDGIEHLCRDSHKASILLALCITGSLFAGLLGVVADLAGPYVREVVLDGQGMQLSGGAWRRRIAWSTVRGIEVDQGLYWPVPLDRRRLVVVLVNGKRISIPCAGSSLAHSDAFLAAARRAQALHERDQPTVPAAIRVLRI
ncbi:MAG: hypothetical protein AAF211_17140 [Myxococcota bacterium]